MQQAIAQTLAAGAAFSAAYRLRRPDASVRWVLAQGPCAFGGDGKPLRFLGISFGITGRKTAQCKRESLATLTRLIRTSDDPGGLACAAARMLGEVLNASRVGCDTIDTDRDWPAPAVDRLAGMTPLRESGSFIDRLERDEFIHIAGERADLRTAAAAPALEARFARAFINLPVVEHDATLDHDHELDRLAVRLEASHGCR